MILPFMIIVFYAAVLFLGRVKGYFTGFIIYWIYCLLFSILLLKRGERKLSSLFKSRPDSNKGLLYSITALIPAAGVFFIQFLPYISLLNRGIILLIIFNSLFNGFIEELYWRGLYLLEFRDSSFFGFWLSTILFGAWHIALYTIVSINFGGFIPLVGGALIMGLIWGLCARKTGSILFPVLGHITVNLFAFTGLYIENSF